ncbi:sensor histidine kinase [Lysinibacter cavernae]|uniref:Sensor-like histidine kinase SenX3 n=1 Tax=Lysinibacter cavernae TaxID=1640652 RepID=A0A7X5R3M2_9MICO|nr:ATP-binding protein [Lysinibacter cavernae]NIH55048.1 two-component system sensor histidine kinase SenX3 [Lysinibacter cavernae]
MESVWLVLLALSLGLLVGVGFTLIGLLAARRGRESREAQSPTVSAEVADVLEAVESFAVILDSSLNVIYANDAAQQSPLVGEGLLRHGALQAVAGDVLATGESVTIELRDEFASADRQGERQLGEAPEFDADGLDHTGENLWVRGARLGSRFVFIVVEDRGDAWRLDAMRRDFIANVSHELKTPVSAVSLLAEALQEAADDPEMVSRFASRLSTESARLANLTSDIIRLSAAQESNPAIANTPLSVNDLLARVLDEHRTLAEQRTMTVVVARADGLRVFGDAEALGVAFSNLVSNAINYSPDGSHIGIGVTVVEDPEGAPASIEIAVTDQGRGIPPEDLDRIFERFYRVDPARSRDTGGTGLGLSIVKNTVQGHGGRVRVWSRPGDGSTFTVTLPLHEDSADHVAPAKPVTAVAPAPRQAKTPKSSRAGNIAKAEKPAKPGKAKKPPKASKRQSRTENQSPSSLIREHE